MKLGSLFDGSGGFPLAGTMCGIEPKWASEVEPYPIAVTKSRFPDMKHLGDISKVNGAEIEPVDIITFGSPCQDLSVAGKRAGLKHEVNGDEETTRSGLFMEAVRIIKEMRKSTNGVYPRFALWENVPGAFSSNKGEDFRVVLEELIKIIEPTAVMPEVPKGGWAYADVYCGDGWSLAYRVFDAQYWGVPQRRRRIYLVADFRGESASEILFKREGLSGYSAEGFRSWQRTAGSTADRTGTASLCLNDQGGQRMDVTEGVAATLRAEAHHPPVVMEAAGFCTEHSSKSRSIGYEEEISPTLRAGVVPATVALENHPTDSRIKISEDGKVQMLTSRMGTGGNNVPLVMKIRSGCEGGGKGPLIQTDKSATLSCNNDQTLFEPKAYGICSKESNAMKSDNPHSGIYEADTSRTLDGNGGNPGCNQGGIAVVESYAIQGSMIGRDDKNGPQGDGINKDVSFTLNTVDRHAVYAMTTGSFTQVTEDQSPTLMARDFKDLNAVCYGIGRDTFNQEKNAKFAPSFCEELQPTLIAKGPGAIQSGYIVRRLTPTECARLQGFPDRWGSIDTKEDFTEEEYAFWCEVRNIHAAINGKTIKNYTKEQMLNWYGKLHTDSAEYKMWGNGIALPTALYCMQGIAGIEEKA